MLYKGSNSSNTSYFALNVTPQSDYSSFELNCFVHGNKYDPCHDLQTASTSCGTSLSFTGVLGCDYNCYFVTKKDGYLEKHSTEYRWRFCKNTYLKRCFYQRIFILVPSEPYLYVNLVESQRIKISWSMSETTYVESFDLFINQNQPVNIHRSEFSYTLDGLLPNRP